MLRQKIVIEALCSSILTLVCSFVAVGQQVRSVIVQANPVNYRGPCPATITFTGKIRISGPGEVRYVWRRSGGDPGPVQTLVFPAPGELEVTDTWQLSAAALPPEMRFEGLRVLSPQLRDSAGAWFSVQCQGGRQGQGGGPEQGAGQGQEAEDPQPGQQQHGPGLGLAVPDLTVSFSNWNPNVANPRASLLVRNTGSATAPGTIGTHDPDHGFMIDVVLSTDREMPAEPAVFSPNFSEDVMIRGGRISRTYDVLSRGTRTYSLAVEVPANTPAGNYFVCARIDPFNKIMESIEANNIACVPFVIRPRQ